MSVHGASGGACLASWCSEPGKRVMESASDASPVRSSALAAREQPTLSWYCSECLSAQGRRRCAGGLLRTGHSVPWFWPAILHRGSQHVTRRASSSEPRTATQEAATRGVACRGFRQRVVEVSRGEWRRWAADCAAAEGVMLCRVAEFPSRLPLQLEERACAFSARSSQWSTRPGLESRPWTPGKGKERRTV